MQREDSVTSCPLFPQHAVQQSFVVEWCKDTNDTSITSTIMHVTMISITITITIYIIVYYDYHYQ